jgi:hypothetical protein
MNRETELELDLIELKAYESLQYQNFDFGDGSIKNDGDFSVKIENYNQIINELSHELSYLKENKTKNKQTFKQKTRENKYFINKKHKEKLKSMSNKHWTNVSTRKHNYPKVFYRESHSKKLKKISNKAVRKYNGRLNGKSCDYKKVFDYWWELR